jgi:hypothetical protein
MSFSLEDSALPLASCKQGYYLVGQKRFLNKVAALIEVTKVQKPLAWDFSAHVFQAQLAKPRLDVPLLQLYKERAQQLREKYDYLILAYSGGSDSDNILKAFIDNGIKLDEVWCDWPKAIIEKSGYIPNLNTDATNMASEWYYVIEPELKKLATTNPEIKIHLSDCSVNPQEEDNETTLQVISAMSVYSSMQRWRYIREYLEKKQSKAALVLGMDKVVPAQAGLYYGFSFTDGSTFFKSGIAHSAEYFYWTPDFPAIITEQAYRVWDYLKLNAQYRAERMAHTGPEWYDRHKGLDHLIKQICYPKWDFSKHQCSKAAAFMNQQFEKPFALAKNERFMQSWASNRADTLKLISPASFTAGRGTPELIKCTNFHAMGRLDEI